MDNKFYVYEWFNIQNNEVFYVGKGCKNRYKEISRRNKLFKEYYINNKVDVRIVKNNLNEIEALKEEEKLIDYYKKNGQCFCNLMRGGTGGLSFIWTEEAKKNWSINNPMKEEKQRLRMSTNNPMKDKKIALKNGAKHKRPVVINGKYFDGLKDAAEILKVDVSTIGNWCKRGYNTEGKPCRYADEEQKEYQIPKNGKAIIIDDIYYFESLKEAGASFFGIKDTSPLCKALKNNQLYKGHKCEYANQQPSQVKVK